MVAPYSSTSSSSPGREQRATTANNGVTMATSHRILSLNKAWEENHRQPNRFVDSSSSSSDSDSSGDIVNVPKHVSGKQASSTSLSATLASSLFKLPASASRTRETPVPVPRPGTSNNPVSSTDKRNEGFTRPPETPVPLPRSMALNTSSRPHTPAAAAATSSSLSVPQVPELRSDGIPQSRCPIEESTSKTEQVRDNPDHQVQKDEPKASVGKSESTIQVAGADESHETKAQSIQEQPSSSNLHFATPSELLARIMQSAVQSSVPNSSQLPNKSGGPSTDDSTEDEEYNQNDLLLSKEPKTDGSQVFIETCDGRPYSTLRHADGSIEVNRGIILPTNYTLRSEAPRYICPVRDCQTLLKNVISLSGHFSAKHCACTFNDNKDGTLSKIGNYRSSVGLSPAIVISQNPLPEGAPPPVNPRPPTNVKLKSDDEQRSTPAVLTRSSSNNSLVVSDIPPVIPRVMTDPAETGRYLHSFLGKGQVVPRREDVRIMINLPKRRNLPIGWIEHHRGGLLPVTVYACALAFVVGDAVEGPKACRLPATSRLSTKCIALPSVLSYNTKRLFSKLTTCVGCHYRSHIMRRSNLCDWVVDNASEDVEPEPEPEAEPSQGRTRELRLKRSAPVSSPAEEPRPRKTVKTLPQLGNDREPILEMEEWEMAPGRLTDESGSENVAYSGPFLMSSQPIQVSPDIGMHVVLVNPGSSNRWTAEANKIRLCTVASGKVRIKLDDTEFLIGPNGGFQIKPEQTCLVENRTYFNATIHCVTIRE